MISQTKALTHYLFLGFFIFLISMNNWLSWSKRWIKLFENYYNRILVNMRVGKFCLQCVVKVKCVVNTHVRASGLFIVFICFFFTGLLWILFYNNFKFISCKKTILISLFILEFYSPTINFSSHPLRKRYSTSKWTIFWCPWRTHFSIFLI